MTDVKDQLTDLAGRVDDNDASLLAVAVGRIAELEAVSLERMTAQERNGAALGAERAAHSLTRGRVDELLRSYGEATDRNRDLQARFDRLLVAFHDYTRCHMGVSPLSGDEFYDARMADEAEARRVRYGRGR